MSEESEKGSARCAFSVSFSWDMEFYQYPFGGVL